MKPDKIYILDGGLGSELEADGFKTESDPLYGSSLLLHNEKAIFDVHRRFLDNGSDIITTATYQASLKGFTENLLISIDEAKSLIQKAVRLAQQARDQFITDKSGGNIASDSRDKLLVAGSVGPYGAILLNSSEYHGQYVDKMSKDDLKEWHRPRIQCLVDAGVDLLAMETIPASKEAEALIELIKEFPSTKAWLSFSCKDAEHTCHGELFRDSVKSCLQYDSGHQLVAIGVNCSKPSFVSGLLRQAGDVRGNVRWYGRSESPKVVSSIEEWLLLGAEYIGGCCRIYSGDIKSIKEEILRIYAK